MSSILIVDDSAYQRSIIRGYLESRQYNVLEAVNGRDGVEKAISAKPDCILMDIVMPDMDGIQALKSIKEKGLQIPVVVVTADIQDSTKKMCMNLGAVGFINKPVKGDSLHNLLNIIKCYIE